MVVNRELKISKGQQEALILGELQSRFQHHSATWASTVEEYAVLLESGVVRAKDRWTFCSRRAHITALATSHPLGVLHAQS